MAPNGATKPLILLISLNFEPFFDEMYATFFDELGQKATLMRAKQLQSALRLLLSEELRPQAVLITDEALTDEKNLAVWEGVLEYVRQGGTSIVMGHFPSFVEPDDIKPFFSKAELPWEAGSCHRTTVVLNRRVVKHELAALLPAKYSQKALFVKNVAPADAWYVTDERSIVESGTFRPISAHKVGESPAVLARVGNGNLGYIGYVNAGEKSNAVILAMCGLSGC
ncbi:hypothetical protein F4819DRAFT_434572 [Hypoxylon fuscum]|nr:hypothetical protein F4819DRAFT_434572 [Hypoxylon fuscum]